MQILKKDKENNNWLEYYIDLIQINQRLINDIGNKNFNLI